MTRTLGVLLVGPTSGLAEEFVLSAPPNWTFRAIGRRGPTSRIAARIEEFGTVDARSLGELEYAVRADPSEVVVTFLQEGERRRSELERPSAHDLPSGAAWEVNTVATEAVARASSSEGKRCLVLSTDEVFAGSPHPVGEGARPRSWPENPSWYGATWAEAEERVRRTGRDTAILRVSILFGWRSNPLCDVHAAQTARRVAMRGSTELRPTFVPDAVRALRYLAEVPEVGSFHAAVPDSVRPEPLIRALDPTGNGQRPQAAEPPFEWHPGLLVSRLSRAVTFTPFPDALAILRDRESGPSTGEPPNS